MRGRRLLCVEWDLYAEARDGKCVQVEQSVRIRLLRLRCLLRLRLHGRMRAVRRIGFGWHLHAEHGGGGWHAGLRALSLRRNQPQLSGDLRKGHRLRIGQLLLVRRDLPTKGRSGRCM